MTNEFWLVFSDATHWTSFFTEPGFMHVMCITKVQDQFICINPIKNEFEIILMAEKNEEEFIERLKQDHKMLYVKSKKVKHYQFMTPQWFTCVSMMKYMMGIKVKGVTPYGLYKHLLHLKYNNKLPGNILAVNEIN